MRQFKRPISIETNKLTLREMQIGDTQYWFAFMQLPSIMEFLPDRFETLQDMREVLAWLIGNYDMNTDLVIRITLAIHPKGDNPGPIGLVSFGPLPEDNSRREIAFAVHPDWCGQGIATEAASALVAWIRVHVTGDSLFASVDGNNGASLRVLEKLQFERIAEHDEIYAASGTKNLIFRLD